MQLKTRLTILLAFVGIFLVTVPVAIFYTAGYRWNFKKQKIEKVGILFIRSQPSGATISLDGDALTEKTPSRIRNLMPGTYDVAVSKNGYVSWEKRLDVQSALTTFAERIVLWKNSPSAPTPTLAASIDSSHGDNAVLITKTGSTVEAVLYNLVNGSKQSLYRTVQPTSLITGFSKDGSRVYVAVQNANITTAAFSFVTSNPGTPVEVSVLDQGLDAAVNKKTAPYKDEVFATDGFEIWTEDAQGNRETVTRISDEIVAIAPYTTGSYIFYQTKTAIHAIERDGRDTRNDVTLATGANMDGMAVSSDGSTLYYVADNNGQSTLFKLALQ